MENRKHTIIIGLGNTLMGDDGVGIYLVNALREKRQLYPHIDFIDLGASDLKVLHSIAFRKKAVLLDCAFMGKPPGTILRFRPGEIMSASHAPALSSHTTDLLTLIELSKKVGECPEEIIIFGIEPEKIEQSDSLSTTLQKQMGNYIVIVEKEIREEKADA